MPFQHQAETGEKGRPAGQGGCLIGLEPDLATYAREPLARAAGSGGEIRLEGIVTYAHHSRSGRENEYGITTGDSDHKFLSRESIPTNSSVRIQGEIGPDNMIIAKGIEVLAGAAAKDIYDKVKANATKAMAAAELPGILADSITAKLWPRLREIAAELAVAGKLRRPVLLRFHGDADGICGAFALSEVLRCKAFQQNSAVYSARDALRDIGFIGQESRPLVILLDFGSSDACAEGLELLRASGAQCIVIDHHPLGSRPPQELVSPFQVSDKSSYTAGYLACEIAAACGLDREKAGRLARIACAGDKSEILAVDEEDRKKAMVLDFLASHVSFGNNLDFYKNVMSNPELFASIARQADESIEEAAGKAMAGMKTTKAGALEIAVIPLEKVAKRGEWPSSSKITTRIYDKLRSGGRMPLICIGYTDRSVIMRLTDEAVAMGLSANTLAERIKTTMADFVDGGGGHAKAGAIRVKAGFVKEVVNELVRTAKS